MSVCSGSSVDVFFHRQAFPALTGLADFAILEKFGAVPKWPKGEVCKTSIRGFESHPRLQAFRFKSVDYNFHPFSAIPNLGTFGNNWKKGLFQTLD